MPRNPINIQNHSNQGVQKKAVILIGPPAAGKSMVSKAFIEDGAKHYSSSRALTQYARRHGLKDILDQMRAGELVDYKHVQLVSGWDFQDFISYQPFGLFDGWFRIEREPEEVIPVLMRFSVSTDVVFLDADPDAINERLAKRLAVEGRLDDADTKAIQNRIRQFSSNFNPLLQVSCHLLGEDRVHIVNTSDLRPAEVVAEVRRAVGIAR